MGIFDFFKTSGSNTVFVSKAKFSRNFENQNETVPEVLKQLRDLNVDENQELKLEYFFYTNTMAKSENLAEELRKLNYTVQNGVSAGDKNLFIITGWTNRIKMSTDDVTNWAKAMCEIGYKNDCDFDGWGTSPD